MGVRFPHRLRTPKCVETKVLSNVLMYVTWAGEPSEMWLQKAVRPFLRLSRLRLRAAMFPKTKIHTKTTMARQQQCLKNDIGNFPIYILPFTRLIIMSETQGRCDPVHNHLKGNLKTQIK